MASVNHGGPPATGVAETDKPRVNRSLRVAAGAFLALVLVALLLVFTREGNEKERATRPAASSPTAPASRALETPIPTSPPTGVRWKLYRGVALPYSAQAGPTRIDGEIVGGFAHTPTGALLAATHAGYRYRMASDSSWRAVTKAMVQPGPGRDAWVRLRSKYTLGEAPSGPNMLQMAGFRFVTYTPDLAVMQVATRGKTGVIQMTTSTVAWDGDDWKLVLQPDGSESPTAQRLSSLDGFVPWSGV